MGDEVKVSVDQSTRAAAAPLKAGWKTSEFWLTMGANIIGALMASGIIVEGTIWGKAIGLAAMVLSTLGYQVSRAQVKK
jgi:hypothetical protein